MPQTKNKHDETNITQDELAQKHPKLEENKNQILPNILDGVIILARRNRRNRFFLPSKQNFFGPIQFDVVMVDSGCNTILLPLAKDQIRDLSKHFPPQQYMWEIGTSQGVQSQSLTLKIKPRAGTIPVQLCQDLFQNTSPSITLPYLRFHLCDEDVVMLCTEKSLAGVISSHYLSKINDFKSKNTISPNRRTHVLLGQKILGNYSCIQHGEVIAVVDSMKFVPKNIWYTTTQLEEFLKTVTSALPDNFDDLEDDDHDGNDEEVYELGDDEFVDE